MSPDLTEHRGDTRYDEHHQHENEPHKLGCPVPAHDLEMAKSFLAALDPSANKFTCQLCSDIRAGGDAEVIHGSLEEVWPKVIQLNTPEAGVGVFITVNETDFKGRSSENIVR